MLSLPPRTLHQQLQQMEPYAEMKVLIHHSKCFDLFENFDSAIVRLEALRNIDKRLISFYLLCFSDDNEYADILYELLQSNLLSYFLQVS